MPTKMNRSEQQPYVPKGAYKRLKPKKQEEKIKLKEQKK